MSSTLAARSSTNELGPRLFELSAGADTNAPIAPARASDHRKIRGRSEHDSVKARAWSPSSSTKSCSSGNGLPQGRHECLACALHLTAPLALGRSRCFRERADPCSTLGAALCAKSSLERPSTRSSLRSAAFAARQFLASWRRSALARTARGLLGAPSRLALREYVDASAISRAGLLSTFIREFCHEEAFLFERCGPRDARCRCGGVWG